MLILGALLMIFVILRLPLSYLARKCKFIAFVAIIVLGISFSLVPAALWPSIPKIMETRYLGSAYSLIFWVQNIGLCFVPVIIGNALASSNANNEAVIAAKALVEQGQTDILIPYNYTVPMVIFACFGVAALLLALYLKIIDKKKGFGLELPNIKK